MGDGFRYPLMLTGLGQLVSAIAGEQASYAAMMFCDSLRAGACPSCCRASQIVKYSVAAGWLASFSGYPSLRIGPRPDLAFTVTRLLPVVMCQAGSMFFGNFAYLSLSVSFIQILKVSCW